MARGFFQILFLLLLASPVAQAGAKAPLPDFDQIEFERYGQDSHYFVVMPGTDKELIGYQIKVARNPQRTTYGYLQLPLEHPICKRLDQLFQRKLKVRQPKMDRRPASSWLTVKTHSKNGEKLYHKALAGKTDQALFDDLESLVRTSQQ